jgi:tetratricopeptide (TPR) repeat protein
MAIAKAPMNYEAYYNLGLIHYRHAEYADAERHFSEAISQRDSESGLYYYRLGAAQKHNGKALEAMDAFHKALMLDPSQFNAHKQLCGIYSRMKNTAKAQYHRQQYLIMHRALSTDK